MWPTRIIILLFSSVLLSSVLPVASMAESKNPYAQKFKFDIYKSKQVNTHSVDWQQKELTQFLNFTLNGQVAETFTPYPETSRLFANDSKIIKLKNTYFVAVWINGINTHSVMVFNLNKKKNLLIKKFHSDQEISFTYDKQKRQINVSYIENGIEKTENYKLK